VECDGVRTFCPPPAPVSHPSRRDDYDDADFYREQVEKEERLAGLR
jgi:hypothetical protein